MKPPVYVDGRPVSAVSARDRGLQFGDGLFETCAMAGGRIELADRHYARLRSGLGRLQIAFDDWAALRNESELLARRTREGVLKIVVTRGSGGRGYAPPLYERPRRIVYVAPRPVRPQALRLSVCATRLASGGSLAGLKHLNRLEQVLGRREVAALPDADDGLMLDTDGHVIETTSCNLFIVTKGRLCTPELSRCGVAGVMRDIVLERSDTLGIDVDVRQVSLQDVARADEVFVTNALLRVTPVSAVGGRRHAVGPLTRRLAADVDAYIEGGA